MIAIHGTHKTLSFAARELAKHLELALGKSMPIVKAGHTVRKKVLFRLGLSMEFGCRPPRSAGEGDDWVCIQKDGDSYVLCGSNPRSVLFAVYRYLHELGFRWIRPGKRGLIVPTLRSCVARNVNIKEAASYRYRTICIEGACSEQHVVDLVDWMAKQGMNGYFIQFDYGACFWRNWYRHAENKHMSPEPCSMAKVQKIVTRVIRELQKRDMNFERMGHGWTCEPLGIQGEGWSQSKATLSPAKRKWLAEIDGKRQFWHGVPLNTNLCYSNPEIREKMADAIARYAGDHPEVDLLHLWLADGSNNNCECKNCRKARPSDFYVDLLNEVDEKLAAAGLNTRIVFLIYVDLLWPPVRSRIRNQDRFTLMFAPITRSYLESFVDSDGSKEKMTKFALNKLEMPGNVQVNIQYLKQWQKMFKGDGFDFDYHLIWTCYCDPNQYGLAKVFHKDIQGLGSIGLDGLNSCQNQRMSFPHNLLMDVMARTLWDKRLSFSRIVEDSFRDAYGRDGEKVAGFFRQMSALWNVFYDGVHLPTPDEARRKKGLANTKRIVPLMADCRKLVKRNLTRGPDAVRWSWRYLSIHLDMMALLVPAMAAYLNRVPETKMLFEQVYDFVRKNEKVIHPALDVFGLIKVLRWRVNELQEFEQKS